MPDTVYHECEECGQVHSDPVRCPHCRALVNPEAEGLRRARERGRHGRHKTLGGRP